MSDALPEGRLLLVSPHLDDAALSCAAILERAEPVDVLTVFTGQPDPPERGFWDALTGFASSAESVPARLAEEQRAFSGTSHRVAALPLLELQYVHGPRPDLEARQIADAVGSWLGDEGGAVALPAGAGFRPGRVRARLQRYWPPRDPQLHPDHVYVRDAVAQAVGGREDTTLLFYEELPYRWGGSPAREVARLAGRLGRAIEPLVVQVDRQAKAARAAAYASQIPHLLKDGERLDDPAALPPDERYWSSAPNGADAAG